MIVAKCAGIIGAGAMGSGIAQVAAGVRPFDVNRAHSVFVLGVFHLS